MSLLMGASGMDLSSTPAVMHVLQTQVIQTGGDSNIVGQQCQLAKPVQVLKRNHALLVITAASPQQQPTVAQIHMDNLFQQPAYQTPAYRLVSQSPKRKRLVAQLTILAASRKQTQKHALAINGKDGKQHPTLVFKTSQPARQLRKQGS